MEALFGANHDAHAGNIHGEKALPVHVGHVHFFQILIAQLLGQVGIQRQQHVGNVRHVFSVSIAEFSCDNINHAFLPFFRKIRSLLKM